jgi:hypothetical protein
LSGDAELIVGFLSTYYNYRITMVLPATLSRRKLLSGMGVGLAVALSGCSGSETDRLSSEGGTVVTDHATEIVRSGGEQPPIIALRENTNSAENGEETPPSAESFTQAVIESENDAEGIEFAEDATNLAAVRHLVTETAYASESVFLYQTPIGECYDLQLNYITRDEVDGDLDIEFCRVIREAAVDCERDARNHVAAAVRLPFPADEYKGFSAGGGPGCDPIPERYRNESGSP